jgi:hypothetical protein
MKALALLTALSALAERFQQAWSAMADALDVCAGTSFR